MGQFKGFSKTSLQFLRDLKLNNSKSWFYENRHIYDEQLLPRTQDFVVDMGKLLQDISKDIVAIPKVDKSIFRLHKDVRFSKDKRPYKTHIGIFIWEGNRKKLENSGYYIQFTDNELFIGVGMYMIPRPMLATYRDFVVHPKKGKELQKFINQISKNKNYKLGWDHFKRIPKGYDESHINAQYLKFQGLGFSFTESIPEVIYSSEFVAYIFEIFKNMAPIHQWLLDMTNSFQK